MKKTLICMLIVLIFGVFTFSNGESTTYNKSIEEYINMALTNNLDLKIKQIDVEAKLKAYEDALETKDRLPDAYGVQNVLSNKYAREVTPIEKLADYNLSISQLDKAEKSVSADIEKTCLDIILKNMKIENESKILELMQEKQQIMEVKYENGLITKSVLENARLDVLSQNINIDTLKNSLKQADYKLKSILNIELSSETLEIVGEIKRREFKEINIDEYVASKMQTDGNVLYADSIATAKANKLDINAVYYDVDRYEYKTVEIEKENASLSLINAKNTLETNLRNSYNTLLNEIASLDLLEKQIDLADDNNIIMEKKYQVGLIGKEEFINSSISYLRQKFSLLEKIVYVNGLIADFN